MVQAVEVAGRTAPVIAEADVVVVGGGSAGIAAAVAAAEQGARCVLLERYGSFGGNATAAWVGTICGLYRSDGDEHQIVCAGFARRWAEELSSAGMGFGPVPFKRSAVFLYVPWGFKRLADRLVMTTPNLTPLLHSTVTDVVRDGARVVAVVIGSKRGPLAVRGSVFIDTSGDADLLVHAGAPVAEEPPLQFPSMQFMMQNVDVGAAVTAGMETLQRLLAEEGQRAPWNLSRSSGAVLPTGRPGEVYGAMTRIAVDGHAPDMTDPFEATAAEMAGRAEAEKAGRFLVEHMPGFANAFLADTPTQLGVRETRRAAGEYVLSGEDVLGAARFDDAVACGAWPQEFHTRGKETEYRWLDAGAYYQVPYRALLPRGLENVLVAGRCMSATHEALASTRVIAPSMAMGEAAGVAGAIAARTNGATQDVDVEEVRTVLTDRGAFLG